MKMEDVLAVEEIIGTLEAAAFAIQREAVGTLNDRHRAHLDTALADVLGAASTLRRDANFWREELSGRPTIKP